MAFMISRETENVQSAQDVEAAFRALTSNERPYILAQELYAVSLLLINLPLPFPYLGNPLLHKTSIIAP